MTTPQIPGPLRRRWSAGEPALGTWCSTAAPAVVELLAEPDVDFVLLDAQHGLYGFDALVQCLVALGSRPVAPVVRIAANDAVLIGRVLDAGALGVVVPMVETAEDARRAVRAFRYPPAGERSFGPLRAGRLLGRSPERLSAEPVCLVMVESARGVANVEEIVAVDGVDGVFLGPADLAVGLGLPPTPIPVPGPHADAIERVRKACLAAGVQVGMPCADAVTARDLLAQGYTVLTIGSDVQWLAAAADAATAGLRGPDAD
ncbi:aldolase/citrate lyase family protein [Streptosporangium sp. NPDC001681]|uniref:HpcH/HpaI aldolase family protein n=1 Tax=Streptosporangium sp. NPDC001681 TaxID=3154395 RepID=UPI00331C5AB3